MWPVLTVCLSTVCILSLNDVCFCRSGFQQHVWWNLWGDTFQGPISGEWRVVRLDCVGSDGVIQPSIHVWFFCLVGFFLLQLNVSSYLQLLCLAEDMRTDPADIRSLLRLNGCDIRQSLLQLQFWTRSAGGRHGARPLVPTGKNGKKMIRESLSF